ncbi:hypothetical protein AQUCO_01400436v1 [Aquilegia coerulea]|uniref:Agenet domain-containing protein n=1 Tax=Aquilegia coerulea TaxID=218851 RepID=A0A2G5DWF6_AQUCA|nr:hypothetical protein AQUCO_01400436v1 [Aquilegia coerulea]
MRNNMFVYVEGQEVEVRSFLKRLDIWYVGKIIRVLREENKYLVAYPTCIQNPLEEIVPYYRLRPPPPPQQHDQNQQFQLNQVVEAFFNDAWCKGIITKIHTVGCPWYTVFFKDEEKEMVFKPFNLRVHLQWINEKWFTSLNKETEVLAQNHGSSLTPTPISSSICGADMDVSQTPSERMGSPSTPNKTQAEMIAIARNDGTLLAPIQTGGSSCCRDMSTSIKPIDENMQKEQHPGLPSTQMKEVFECTEIKVHGIGGMDNQIVVYNATGGHLIGSGPENEVVCEELAVDQMETTQLLGTPVEECLPLSPSLEKSNSPVENENKVLPDNQLIPTEAIAPIDASMESLVLFESSNAIENVFGEGCPTLNPLIQNENASGDESSLRSANSAASTSLAQHDEGPLTVHDESLPFIKSSPLWETFES